MDNVFIERPWRSLKHEDIYLKGYVDGRERSRNQTAGDLDPDALMHPNKKASLAEMTTNDAVAEKTRSAEHSDNTDAHGLLTATVVIQS